MEFSSFDVGFDLGEVRLLERGHRATGRWPSDDPFEAFTELLEKQIAQEDDPEQRSKLQAVLGAVIDVGKGTASGLLTAYLKHVAGI